MNWMGFSLVLALGFISIEAVSSPVELKSSGHLGQLYLEGKEKSRAQNFSGMVYRKPYIYIVDDGGFELPSKIYRWHESLTQPAVPLDVKLPKEYSDFEDITLSDDYFYIATSLAHAEPDDLTNQWLARLRYDEKCHCMKDLEIANFHKIIANAFKENFDKDWANRVIASEAKSGGLNLEGVASNPNIKNQIVLGFRSPLAHQKFGSPEKDPTLALNLGKAILAIADNLFSDKPKIKFKELDLEGLGVRGIEFIPNWQGYAIISGQADVGNNYGLWFWDVNQDTLEKIPSPELKELCRPESIGQVGSGNEAKLVIISENSGKPCENSKFDYLTYRI